MRDGIRIKTLVKYYMAIPEDTLQRPPGPLRTSQYEHKIMSANRYSSDCCYKSVRKPDAQTVTDSRTLNGLMPLKLAASYTVR